jgi:hypothetical protein
LRRSLQLAAAIALAAMVLGQTAGCARSNRYDGLKALPLEEVKSVVARHGGDHTPRVGIAFGGGGVLTIVPVRFVRAMGADVVIAVDIYCGKHPALRGNALDTVLKTFRLQSCLLSDAEIAEADILIRPEFEPDNPVSFAQRDAAIMAGYRSAAAAIPALKAKIAGWQSSPEDPGDRLPYRHPARSVGFDRRPRNPPRGHFWHDGVSSQTTSQALHDSVDAAKTVDRPRCRHRPCCRQPQEERGSRP